MKLEKLGVGNLPVVQWLGLHASTAGATGSLPGQGTGVSCATWHGQKEKKARSIPARFQQSGKLPKLCENQPLLLIH